MVDLPSDAVNARDISRLDLNTADFGIPPQLLMECAGLQATNKIQELYQIDSTSKVIIFAGTGNNGGDGMVIARHFATRGIFVHFVLCGEANKIRSNEARLNWNILQKLPLNLEISILKDSTQVQTLTKKIDHPTIILDAMLGTGVSGKIREPISSVIDLINSYSCPVVAIDVNTGRDPDSGHIGDKAVKFDFRITFHRDKIGLESDENKWIAPIGTPIEAHLYVGFGDVAEILHKRAPTTHKGQYGKLLIIGGSDAYSGAPSLAALTALELGIDLVIVFVPQSIANVVRTFSPNIIVRSGKSDNLCLEDVENAVELAQWADAILIGPGMGRSDSTQEFFNAFYPKLLNMHQSHVIDADGIYLFAQLSKVTPLDLPDNRIIFTPHLGELQRLITLDNFSRKVSILEQAKQIHEKLKSLNAVVVFKGPQDLIFTPKSWDSLKYRINTTGCPEMSVGGTGDVLAGLIASLFTINSDPFLVGCAGCYINGKLGENAVMRHGNSISAENLIHELRPFLKTKNKNL